MTAPRYSRRAELDLHEIAVYTLSRWGLEQAERYLDRLEACCNTIAVNLLAGRNCDDIQPGLRRFECESHVVFYRAHRETAVIVRILHKRMLPPGWDCGRLE